ncbi:hypothetical protein GLYMA_01G231132v4 [Glycine max]|nr:hypothetical protein GLYMA_01G231132v4 [Glycine max]KAH1164323.1 hypothetical protein GYH30_002391 [Glycine max]
MKVEAIFIMLTLLSEILRMLSRPGPNKTQLVFNSPFCLC